MTILCLGMVLALESLNRLNLTFSDSLGYFGCGLIDGPNVHIKGRVGWSCAENMMAGTVVIDGNAGSTFRCCHSWW